jgi:hypothetical protein
MFFSVFIFSPPVELSKVLLHFLYEVLGVVGKSFVVGMQVSIREEFLYGRNQL